MATVQTKSGVAGSDINDYMLNLGRQARASARALACTDTAAKNRALELAADYLLADADALIAANQRDMQAAGDLEAALLERLELTPARIEAMSEGLRQVAALADPIGEITDLRYRPSGIQVGTMRVPLGVVGIIYESRPNVTADAAALCLKSGNACILRGGSEAIHSNLAIAACVHRALADAGIDAHAVQVLETTDRAAVGAMLAMPEYVDVIVPRGGKGLIERISAEAKMPVIKHLDGICHVYIDDRADLDKAIAIALNAKTHRYGVCNAMETLLIHQRITMIIADRLAPLLADKGVEVRACDRTREHWSDALEATEADYATEYLAPVLSVRTVEDIDEAMAHIDQYGSHHTDAIVTEDYTRARRFMTEVDSSSVMVNVSTRFADGFEYGLGAEIGISTDKFHARGPVGLEGLTSKKYVVLGDGQVRE